MKDKDAVNMLLKEKRLKTFKKWPYGEDTKLNKEACCDSHLVSSQTRKNTTKSRKVGTPANFRCRLLDDCNKL
ncbi:hypothetical protein E2C01_093162 [Portunus trituberculatus]|uniref:Uncharacterized protein n=1 Tax=Portunus trituberculatus TaxID=210409 RepID=A0A5B7JXE6_PORTR|nr:hypothetical protein [Portunus trituberculatus]